MIADLLSTLADWLGGLALELMQGPILLLLAVIVLLFAGWFVQDQWYRWRVRRAQRVVARACEQEAARRVVVPGQRGPS